MFGTWLAAATCQGMKAIDRVMRAYRNTRTLTEEEAARIRADLSEFIDRLLLGQLPDKPPT